MKLDLTKKLQTRDGRPVEIKFTDGRGDYPIVGYIGASEGLRTWSKSGEDVIGSDSSDDIFNVPEWHLPDPPHGYEWHRTDWTEEMLPKGWRPQYVGEIGVKYECSLDGKNWQPGALEDTPLPKTNASYCRTNAPLPPPKPQMREVELCADDIKAGDEFLVGSYRHTWLSIKDGYVTYGSGGIYSFTEMMRHGHKIRSIGETEWRKCSRMEEVPA